MKPSKFQGLNIGKLPLTHTGSVYLMPARSVIGIKGQLRFQNFVNDWGFSDKSLKFLFGTIERGISKGINHLQWVAIADDNFTFGIEKFIKPRIVRKSLERRIVKILNPKSVSGFSDTIHFVECFSFISKNVQISSEKIIDRTASSDYVSKNNDYGTNTVIYIQNGIWFTIEQF